MALLAAIVPCKPVVNHSVILETKLVEALAAMDLDSNTGNSTRDNLGSATDARQQKKIRMVGSPPHVIS